MSRPQAGTGTAGQLTPILTDHARERCAQMGIPTKVVKRIWQHRTLVRGLQDQHRVVVTAVHEPQYALVVDDTEAVPVIITVLFAEREEWVREGTSYRVVS